MLSEANPCVPKCQTPQYRGAFKRNPLIACRHAFLDRDLWCDV